MPRLVKRPSLEEILDFCAREPIERVFLEDVARRGLGRFAGLRAGRELVAVCHLGANLVPSGEGAAAFAKLAARSRGSFSRQRMTTSLISAGMPSAKGRSNSFSIRYMTAAGCSASNGKQPLRIR